MAALLLPLLAAVGICTATAWSLRFTANRNFRADFNLTMTNPKTGHMSIPHSPTPRDHDQLSAPENRTVWLFARPLRSSFFDWLSRGDLVLCHWGLLVSDISRADIMALALQRVRSTEGNRALPQVSLGRMYELCRASDGKNSVMITCPRRLSTLRDSWSSFVYQFVSTTSLKYAEIDSYGMGPLKRH